MRTKALLGLAALVVSAATCVAQQNVYSLNIVGYVNVDIKPGLNLISNPLKPSNGNYNITNTIVLPDAADGASLFTWTGTAWDSVVPQFYGGGIGWDPAMDVALGEGFFLQSPTAAGNYKVTFVGEVQTGDVSYTLAPGLNVVAPKIPVAEPWPGKDIGNDGDSIYTWTGTAWNSAIWQYYGPEIGWDGPEAGNTAGPTIPVGGAVVYQNTKTTPINWTRQFNPQ
jgi:hypothetical protein